MLKFGKEPFLECSSKGDKRFSAFNAKIRKYNNESIEKLYQSFKIFSCQNCDGFGYISNGIAHSSDEQDNYTDLCDICGGSGRITNLGWKEAKGKEPLNKEGCIEYYNHLWLTYLAENPDLLDIIYNYNGFSDIFGQENHNCQAEVIYNIRSGKLIPYTSIVNIRHHKYDVYIGRKGKGEDGYFGNPHPVGYKCYICNTVHKRGETIELYKSYFYNKIKNDEIFHREILKLRGKRLGCFCKREPNDNIPCHGDIIRDYLDNYI